MKNYKKIMLVFIVVILILLFYFFYKKVNQNITKIENNNKVQEEIEEEVNLEIYSSDYKLNFQAVVEKNDKYCNHLKDSTRDECLYDIGSVNREIKFCEMISDQNLRDDCVESIASFMLINANNIEACNNLKIERYRDQCYKEILKTKNDLDFCDKISVNYADICYDIVHQNMALLKKDLSFCDKIKDDFYKGNCEVTVVNLPIDSDGDGISDEDEMIYGTNPFVSDSDLLNISTK